MQFFGKYDTRFDKEFLVESYLYFNQEDEELTPQEFEKLIKSQKDRKKNIAGTIFMYNPFYYPQGFDEKLTLTKQGFEFDGEFHNLKIEKEMTLFKQKIKQYPGKIVQVRFLFNLNTAYIDKSENLVSFNEDIEKLNTNQLTVFDKDMNYTDLNNFHINGKFVFFSWGNKINRKEFTYIHEYAQTIYDKCKQMQKKISFVYRKSMQESFSEESLAFLHPFDNHKLKNKMPYVLEEVFKENPPKTTCLDDLG